MGLMQRRNLFLTCRLAIDLKRCASAWCRP
ncbi:hypothetical protein J3R04_005137 [Spirilliplanes yamanashiensis]|nr:hypothetical protein [Spirilliplanes yamanashiensis]